MLNQLINNQLAFIIVLLVFVADLVGIVTLFIPFLIKKNPNVQTYLKQAKVILTTAEDITNTVSAILPAVPAISTLKILEVWASKAVNGAEQLFLSAQSPADQRNAKAKETIYAALKISGIIITPELETLIDGAVEESVLALGHAAKVDTILCSKVDSTIASDSATAASTSDQSKVQVPVWESQVPAAQAASAPVTVNIISADELASLTNIVQKLQDAQAQ